ncbi:MAG: hypothetical protein A2Y25_07945 [Candidatus Melainabacteria bacterium GWF2_37_15]|nr:MAG: hypothetical protein A2Y25_07945 [Candidatus Melainabacteria bacterium GWF2_37_15]
MDLLLEHLGKGLLVMLLISMPAVLIAAAIGLVVGILQAVTQVQEQTIAAAPKILGVFLVIMLMGPFSMQTLMDYVHTSANIAFGIVPRDEETVLSGSDFYIQKKKMEDKEYVKEAPSVQEIMKRAGKVPYVERKTN